MGATRCVACGESLFAAPAGLAVAPAVAAPPVRLPPRAREQGGLPPAVDDDPPDDLPLPASALPRRAGSLCKLCFGPCDTGSSGICASCGDTSGKPERRESDVGGDYASRLGSRHFRPIKTRRPSGVGRAVFRIVFAAALVVGGFAVVRFVRHDSPSLALLRGVTTESAVVAADVPDDSVLHYRTELDLRLHRGESASAWDTQLTDVYDVRQVSSCEADVAPAGRNSRGPLLNVRTECSLERSDGIWQSRDGSTRELYPWTDYIAAVCIAAPPDAAPRLVQGGLPVPGRDVPPLVCLGATGAADGDLAIGETWRASARLPGLSTLDGAQPGHAFSCRFEYLGTKLVAGRRSVLLRIDGTPEPKLDPTAFGGLERASGDVVGALAYDVMSGLLVQADLSIDVRAEKGSPRVTARVASTGRVRVTLRR